MKITQRDRMKELFTSKPNEWIPLYDIFVIAKQYNARIYELRHQGMQIEMKEHWANGQRHTAYRYVPQETQQELFLNKY